MKKRYYFLIFILIIIVVISQLKITRTISNTIRLRRYWQENYSMIPPGPDKSIDFDYTLIAKAINDECFFHVGSPENYYSSTQIDCDDCNDRGGKPKANQSYVWSMAEGNGKLFFGTATNYLCQSYMNYSRNDSIHSECQVCEWGASTVGMNYTSNDFYGDFRPPKIYVFNPLNDSLTDLTPYNDEYLNKTLGIRAAGSK